MARLGDIAEKVRSKNAGPFWLTVDIFCGANGAFATIKEGLTTGQVAQLFRADSDTIRRFDIPDLNVIKFSLPRPKMQGRADDRDMHGAGWAVLVAELDLG